MKRIVLFLLALLLLAGCGSDDALPTDPPAEPTAPPVPWTERVGMAWDAEGVLLEMPLTVPDGLHYSAMLEYDGDLLLWSVDDHREATACLELCLIELDDGSVVAQRDVEVSEYVTPQILGEDLYLCDRTAGTIRKLDKALETVHQWTTEPGEGSWYMGDGEKLYELDLDSRFTVRDLSTGQTAPVLEGDPEVSWVTITDGVASIEYYRTDTGAQRTGVLDLHTGQVLHPETEEKFDSISLAGDDWLWGKYMDGYIFYLSVDGGESMRIAPRDSHFTLLQEGYLLETATDNTRLCLYDLQGKLISAACVSEVENGYTNSELIWNDALGGYFLQARSFDGTVRLLFWDTSKSAGGEDLSLTPVPQPDQAQAALVQRAEEMGETYGLTIQVGEACATVFDEFSATQVTDWDRVTTALDTLEEALAAYPEGFLEQLRYSNIRGIRIQLICDLIANGSGRTGDGYAAFTQPQWDYYLMVVDIDDTTAQTYYHEFSHIIDSYLDWDASQRDDALFSEDGWATLNPGWFEGYSYDYSNEHDLDDYIYFVDGYSTISPTEDRARVMEYAMVPYGTWTFEGCEGLLNKLDYYSRCIRDAFDTEGWPKTVLWEQYLYLK